MKALLTFSLNNYALLVMIAANAVLTFAVLRISRRYVNEGVLFRRLPTHESDHPAVKVTEGDMRLDNHIDLDIALRKLHQIGLDDGDLGYAYWHEIGKPLKQAAGMQSRIDELSKELQRCRARLGEAD
ncbi:hypothetical protein [Paraburkholderia sp. Tr-20389]|uniref:hypothetical protein n=1 Tax=Paraburkholderia sp. Tr-20389 TaxID=2703903 RepID=UPI001F1215F2|nr:hypothetical protein [Paraburkholderia sp. Tr-20389]